MMTAQERELVTVYEAINETLKEVYVGTTSLFIDQLGARFLTRLPPNVAHWRADHNILYHAVEYAIYRRDAAEFIDRYAKSASLETWRVFTGP